MTEPEKRVQRAFLLGLRRAKTRHRAEMRDMEDRLDEAEDGARHRAARADEREEDEGS